MKTDWKKAAALVTLVMLLALVCLLSISCGGSGGQDSSGGTGSATIDKYVNELDSQVNSVSPGDFSDSNLSDSSLGL